MVYNALVAKPTRVFWFDVVIVGSKWQVWLASPTDPEMSELDGLCLSSQNVILIDWSLPDGHTKATLFHELLHAIFSMSGFDHAVSDMCGKTMDEWFKIEETIVRLLGPQLVDTMERNGWQINMPPKPTGIVKQKRVKNVQQIQKQDQSTTEPKQQKT